MNRKRFIQSQGATCNNWTTSWSFVNEDQKFIIFGAWDDHKQAEKKSRILSDDWQISPKGRKSSGYKQALEHIRLIENEGYQLKTFQMQRDEKSKEVKIKSFTKKLVNKVLLRQGRDWFAVDKINEEKIARICWNTEHWQKPSGPSGKTTNKSSYESIKGFGHEEWLLDITKVIDGYHYAFVEGVHTHRTKYKNEIFDISFYSINDTTKERWWIGTIKNIYTVDEIESEKVFNIYNQNGWYDEMCAQLRSVGANVDSFKQSSPKDFVVIKFRLNDLELLDEPLKFSKDDPAVTSNYYNLINKRATPAFELGQFKFSAGHNPRKGKTESNYEKRKNEVNLLHNKMQTAIYEQLSNIYHSRNVTTENSTGLGTQIDVVVQHDAKKYSFYEIKTSISSRQCIRDAIGQLLEYAHFGNNVDIKELIVVGPHKITPEASKYLSILKKKYKIPICYQHFDIESNSLQDLIGH